MQENSAHHEQLVKGIAKRRVPVLIEFYREFESLVYDFALNLLGEPFAAAEVLNAVMVDVWQHSKRRPENLCIRLWLIRLTHDHIFEFLREWSAVHPTAQVHITDNQHMASPPKSFDAERLDHAFDHLSPDLREVMYLVFHEKLDETEVVEALNVSHALVRERLKTGLMQIMGEIQHNDHRLNIKHMANDLVKRFVG